MGRPGEPLRLTGGRKRFKAAPRFPLAMELVYLKSPTGRQHERAKRVLAEVREGMPNLLYREVDPREDPDYAAQFPIHHAPGLVVDGRLEYVGIPRPRMLLDRLRQLARGGKGKEKPSEPGTEEAAEAS